MIRWLTKKLLRLVDRLIGYEESAQRNKPKRRSF